MQATVLVFERQAFWVTAVALVLILPFLDVTPLNLGGQHPILLMTLLAAASFFGRFRA